MILTNFFKILDVIFSEVSSTAKNYSGNDTSMSYNNAQIYMRWYQSLRSVKTAYGSGGVVFGDGDTPPTPDDYKLSGEVIPTISGNAIYSRTVGENGVTYQMLYTLNNTGAESVTIKEIGLFAYNAPFMVERTVLDSPVTIPAGGVGQITYTIRMVYPTD